MGFSCWAKCQFFRVYAYRKLFDKHVGGDLDGQYVGLDFGHLRALSRADRKLRDTLLPMTLDVEHFAKVRLLALAEEHDEDGYAIVHGYLGSVSKKQRDHVATELDRRKNDPYSGSLVTKYRNDMPLWVIIEVVSFGTFLDILKYCAEHWGDTDLRRTHYLLKKAKSVRNFCAHGLCALNDLTGDSPQRERTPVALAKAMADRGIPKRLRSKCLASLRMVQICTLVYVYAATVPQGRTRDDRVSELRELFAYAAEQLSALPPQNQARAALSFIERLTRALGLLD